MTINAASNSSSTAFAVSSAISMLSSASSLTSQSTTELTDEEQKYDADGDGTLSVTEKAAYLEAQANTKTLEAASSSEKYESSATVSISEEALKMQKEGRPEAPPQGMPPQGAPQGAPPDVSEMSDDDLKSMLSDMKEKTGSLPKELSSYNDVAVEDMSEEDLENIRETMTEMQGKMQEQKNNQLGNEQMLLMGKAISQYNQFK